MQKTEQADSPEITKRNRAVHDTCQDNKNTEMASQEYEVIRSKVFNFHSDRFFNFHSDRSVLKCKTKNKR